MNARTASGSIADLVSRSADPPGAGALLDRLAAERPSDLERVAADRGLAAAVVAVGAASRLLSSTVISDPAAVGVLAELDRRQPLDPELDADRLVAWAREEQLRVAARDLLGRDDLEATVAAISALAVDVLAASLRLAGAEHLAVVAMGKLGGGELNYASDVDLVLVGADGGDADHRAARRMLAIARRCWTVDTALRPEGRDGPLVRSLGSYQAHWDRWAGPWEFQALLKARPIAGDPALGVAFADAVAERLWNRPFTVDDLRAVRAMKARTEAAVAGGRDGDREVKRGSGGIRDVEFAVQLLQLVHGQLDRDLRVRGTAAALVALAGGGYVDATDAQWLGWGYRFLRRIEHLLQLADGRPVSAVPTDPAARHRLARLLGFRDRPRGGARDDFDEELAACRAAIRQIHERLYFRPLLEAFAGVEGTLTPEAATARLAAFGFTDAERTRQAVSELTRGLTRSSRLMQQLLPLVLDWLSSTPDPDAGLLGLRRLASGPTRSLEVAGAFRDSNETARRLCCVLGTSPKLTDLLLRNPDLIGDLGTDDRLRLHDGDELLSGARATVDLRATESERRAALHRFTDREGLRIGVADVLGLIDTAEVGAGLAALAEAAIGTAVGQATARSVGGQAVAVGQAFADSAHEVPIAVVALGRLGGAELSYASDLDLVVVHGGSGAADQAAAERTVQRMVRFLRGDAPATLVYDVDLDLRPEGRNGPVVRSLDGYRSYFERWARMWERQAMVRARVVAGDRALGRELLASLDEHVWRPLTDDDRREVRRMKARIEAERLPAGDDPAFHLKLGPGAMADVEFCVQLLQLESGTRGTGTVDTIERLADANVLDDDDAAMLTDAYRFCERTRNRLFLLRGTSADALPQGELLARLAGSLDTTAPALRDRYRQVTRRARRVVQRRFYGSLPAR